MPYFPDYLAGLIVFVLGVNIGSFLNVVVYRVPRHESIVFPASHCPNCDKPIRPWDNIPVLSYLILRGRCRNCHEHISIVYPIIESGVGALFLLLFLVYGLTPLLLVNVIFVCLIVPLVFIDLRYKLLPNVITYPGMAAAFIMRILVPSQYIMQTTVNTFGIAALPVVDVQGHSTLAPGVRIEVALLGSMLGALVGGGIPWLIRQVYYVVRRQEGLGLGDVKMMLMVGAFLGWQLSILTVFIGSFCGSVAGLLVMRLRKGTLKTEIPFGVFLGPAAIVALLVGKELIEWYLGRLGK